MGVTFTSVNLIVSTKLDLDMQGLDMQHVTYQVKITIVQVFRLGPASKCSGVSSKQLSRMEVAGFCHFEKKDLVNK